MCKQNSIKKKFAKIMEYEQIQECLSVEGSIATSADSNLC